jgi:L-ascorbate metabolism protein UlaG (beta-lactamase superfamily)
MIEGETQSFAIDPYEDSIGTQMPHLVADYLLVSHEHFDHNNRAAVTVKFPDVVPESVKVVDSFHDNQGGALRGPNKIHIIDIDGQRVCHLGDLGQILSEQQRTEIGEIDTLLIPVGGNYTIDAAEAITVCQQIKPKAIIPMHYLTPGVTVDIAPVDEFVRLANLANLNIKLLAPGESVV